MALEDHDRELLRKIHRIRTEWVQVGLLLWQAGARSPSQDMLFEEVPQIIALFDQYGRDAVLAAVKEANAQLRAALEREITDRGRG